MAKVGRLLLNVGMWNGQRIVSPERLPESVLPRRSAVYSSQSD